MPRKSVKNAILEAAFEIIENGSSSQLTVDAVINRARVSKGGFFHHFESKEALLKAMVDWWLKSFEQDLPSVAVTKKMRRQMISMHTLRTAFPVGVRAFAAVSSCWRLRPIIRN